MTNRLTVGDLAEAFDALIDLDPPARDRWFARTALHPDDRRRLDRLLRIDAEQQFGILDESDLLLAASADAGSFRDSAREHMTTHLQTVAPRTSLAELMPIFDAGRVAIVADEAGFHGLITRVDVLNHLRRRQLAA